MSYLICDDLNAPIQESTSGERLDELLKDKDFVNKGKVFSGGFKVNIKNDSDFERLFLNCEERK